jgi:fatty acid desaturase
VTEELDAARGGPPAARPSSSYTELARIVRENGLLSRRYGYYWSRLCASLLTLAALVAAVVMVGNSWWQLVLAGLLGWALTQIGFLGHDAAHRQMFVSAAWNEWTARILSGAVVGLSYGWWRGKHSRHHAAPNQLGRDPDVASGVLALSPELVDQRRSGPRGWFTRHQGWLFLPLLTLEGVNLHVAAIRSLIESRDRFRLLEAFLILVRLGGLLALLFSVLPPGKATAFLALQLAVFGVVLGGSFAPNHKGMPIVPREVKIDFLHRQVLMSRNVRGNFFVDAAMGGLNYQIEHHLFPSMPRPHLRRVQPLVRHYCAERGIPYTETGFFSSYAAVVVYLNNVGLLARDPFDCPLASQWRN